MRITDWLMQRSRTAITPLIAAMSGPAPARGRPAPEHCAVQEERREELVLTRAKAVAQKPHEPQE